MGRGGIRNAYASGRGSIRVRARCEIEEDKKGRESIVVTEIPYQVNKTRLIERIAELVQTTPAFAGIRAGLMTGDVNAFGLLVAVILVSSLLNAAYFFRVIEHVGGRFA